ncbi:hypothetical protein Pfo_011983, partial [Paulownia fortunei]
MVAPALLPPPHLVFQSNNNPPRYLIPSSSLLVSLLARLGSAWFGSCLNKDSCESFNSSLPEPLPNYVSLMGLFEINNVDRNLVKMNYCFLEMQSDGNRM